MPSRRRSIVPGAEPRVAEWRFVPDTDSILLLAFDGSLLLTGSSRRATRPRSARRIAIDGIARGSSEAIVERLDGSVVHRPHPTRARRRSSPPRPSARPARRDHRRARRRHGAPRRPGRRAGHPDRRPSVALGGRGRRDARCCWRCRRRTPCCRRASRPAGDTSRCSSRRMPSRTPTTPTSCRCPSASSRASSRSRPATRSSRSSGFDVSWCQVPPRERTAVRRRPRPAPTCAGLPVEVAPRLLGGALHDRRRRRDRRRAAHRGRGVPRRAEPARSPIPARTRAWAARPRNATMWGEPGHLYVYLSHGIHSCVNVVCGPEGVAGGILLRAGEVIEGRDAAARRRPARRASTATWRADPGVSATRWGCGIRARRHRRDHRRRAAGAVARLELRAEPLDAVATGPRVGVAGVAGTACLPLALLDRRRSDGLGLPMGPRRGGRRRIENRPREKPTGTDYSVRVRMDSGDQARQPGATPRSGHPASSSIPRCSLFWVDQASPDRAQRNCRRLPAPDARVRRCCGLGQGAADGATAARARLTLCLRALLHAVRAHSLSARPATVG